MSVFPAGETRSFAAPVVFLFFFAAKRIVRSSTALALHLALEGVHILIVLDARIPLILPILVRT